MTKTYVQFQSFSDNFYGSLNINFHHLPRIGDELSYKGEEFKVTKVCHVIDYALDEVRTSIYAIKI